MCLIVMKIESHNLIEIFKDMTRKHGLLNWQSMKHFYCHYLLSLMSSFQTCMTDWLLWNTKEGILKNIGNQIDLVPIDFYYMDKQFNVINGNQNSLVTNILQNIFFCVLHKKESHTGLERRHKGE